MYRLSFGMVVAGIATSGLLAFGIAPSATSGVHGLPRPILTMARSNVRFGMADLSRVTQIPAGTVVTWLVGTRNGAPALISQQGNPVVFVAIAPGSYLVHADVDGLMLTTKVVVYGEASAVTLTQTGVTGADKHDTQDGVSVNVVDSMGHSVDDFNGAMDIHAISGIVYLQHGVLLPRRNGNVTVTIRHGLAHFRLESTSENGSVVPITGSGLTSDNHQAMAGSPTYASITVKVPS